MLAHCCGRAHLAAAACQPASLHFPFHDGWQYSVTLPSLLTPFPCLMIFLSPFTAALRSRPPLPPLFCMRAISSRTVKDAAVNKTVAAHPQDLEYTWDAGLSLLPLEVKALRAHLCDLSAAAVSCPSPSRATLTGVSFPGWAAPSNAFGSALAPDAAAIRPGGGKREVPLLLKRQQMKRLFSAANSPQLQLLCVRIFFNEGGWAKARIVAARKPLPPDHRRESKERELRRQDSHGD